MHNSSTMIIIQLAFVLCIMLRHCYSRHVYKDIGQCICYCSLVAEITGSIPTMQGYKISLFVLKAIRSRILFKNCM